MKSRPRRRGEARAPREERGFQPRPGPGYIYVRELVSAATGRALRYRNIGEHPLTLAHARGRVSDEQFAAGEEFRALYELRAVSGRDSTDFTPSGSAAHGAPFTQTQIDAIRSLNSLRARLARRDWIIVEKFCGEGWSMAEAVRAATLCHPSGVLMRVQEALDELVEACGRGRRRESERGQRLRMNGT